MTENGTSSRGYEAARYGREVEHRRRGVIALAEPESPGKAKCKNGTGDKQNFVIRQYGRMPVATIIADETNEPAPCTAAAFAWPLHWFEPDQRPR